MPPLVTVTPDSLTLNPGESAQVTVQVDPLSDAGVTSVEVGVTVPPQYDYLISGDFEGTIGPGETAHIVGDVNQTGLVFVEGLLTGIDTFHWQGNGFTVFFQNGGQADLHGKYKAPWGEWDTDTTGWEPGDRLAVAPTAVGKYVPSETVWSDWTMPRPLDSPDVTLIDGSVRKPEVVNLDQSVVFENLARGFHFHDSAGIQMMSDIKFLNCGTVGVLSNYPVHFHMLYDNSRGSLLERVVVEGGKNHAFVPHASHGITLKDCVAYNTIDEAFWWDLPEDSAAGGSQHTANNSNDSLWEHCLALWVWAIGTSHGLSAFLLGAGSGNALVDSAASCVQGGKDASGYHWPARANQNIGGNDWVFQRNVVHNNLNDGIFVWQNDPGFHLVEDFVAYHNRRTQIEHGAYTTNYQYRRMVLQGGTEASFRFHSRNGGVLLEDVIADVPLVLAKHQFPAVEFATVRRCQFPGVVYSEIQGSNPQPSWMRFEDDGMIPADFTFTSIHPDSLIEIFEGGVLTHRWAGGWV